MTTRRRRFCKAAISKGGGRTCDRVLLRSVASFVQCCSRRSVGMPTDSAAFSYQELDSKVARRLAMLRLAPLGFLGDLARFFRRSARSTRTATSPYKWRSLLRRYEEIGTGALPGVKSLGLRKSRWGLAGWDAGSPKYILGRSLKRVPPSRIGLSQ